MRPSWTEGEWVTVLALRDGGMTFNAIGERYGLTRNAVQGRIYRRTHCVPSVRRKPVTEARMAIGPSHKYADLKPSKTPFAADDTCPDFAWDEDHCEAVLAQGPFPVLTKRAA